MPMHDWTKVDAGIYHAFHTSWIIRLSDVLNSGILPTDHYALPEQRAGQFGPDVLTLRGEHADPDLKSGGTAVLLPRPKTRFVAESATDFYLRKQNRIAVRHVSDDQTVAVIEIMSPGNKSSKLAFDDFLEKTYALMEQGIHLLIVDPFPPTTRDPHGIHAAIWQRLEEAAFVPPVQKPLTLVSYEWDFSKRAYIEPIAVGDCLPDMPLFLKVDGCVMTPLESTYESAFAQFPQRWRQVVGEGANRPV
ncbi:MAG: DUF4058 family protein [Gemmataceae bacterium]|nr:DUF4058 family protein [Gemmataceae bacterium]